MIVFIDAHRAVHGVEPIGKVLPITPSTYHIHAARRADPSTAPRARRTLEAVAFATLKWGDWFNHRRLLDPIGNMPPAKAEARYYAQAEDAAMAA